MMGNPLREPSREECAIGSGGPRGSSTTATLWKRYSKEVIIEVYV